MAIVVGGELVDEALEPSLGPGHIHLRDEDHRPFGMVDPSMLMASGSSSITANSVTPRFRFPTIAGE